MTTVNFSQFLPRIRQEVRSCPELVLKDTVKATVNEFCRRTGAWKVDHDPITVTQGIPEYELDIIDDALVHDVLSIEVDDVPLEPMTQVDLDNKYPGWRDLEGDVITYFLLSDRATVRLVYTPDRTITQGLVLTVTLRPKRTATVVDEIIYEEYLEAIVDGAKSKLLMMAGKPWTDLPAATVAKAAYETAISNATLGAQKEFSRTPLRTKAIYSLD